MRILYGVCGDGLGHAMRAQVVARHLQMEGHRILFATFGRAASVLRARGFDVLDVRGMHAVYEGGRVRRASTVARVVRETPALLRHNAHVALFEARTFDPDLVLTDFNGFACAVARFLRRPVVSLDHQHVIDRFEHPRSITRRMGADFRFAEAVVANKTRGCDRYVVTSFYFPNVKRKARPTSIVGPIMRKEVEALVPTKGDHLLVYQTSPGDRNLLTALRSLGDTPVIVYGMLAPGASATRIANVELRAFDEARFLADLASARAVASNGGFTTISEALYLGKPVFSIPLAHQGEQGLNAAWLASLGLGISSASLNARDIQRFMTELPDARASFDARIKTGTRDALLEIDRAILEAA